MISPHDFKGPVKIEIQRRARRDDMNEATYYEIELGMPDNPHKLVLQRVLLDGANEIERDSLYVEMMVMVGEQLRPIFRQLIDETAR